MKLSSFIYRLIGVLVIGYLLFFAAGQIIYGIGLERDKESLSIMCCKEKTNFNFIGSVFEINLYEEGSYFDIIPSFSDTTLNRIYFYRFDLNKDAELLDLLYENQKITKQKGDSFFRIYFKNGDSKEIEIPCCKD